MSTKHLVITHTLLASAGTFTVAYPAGVLPEHILGGTDHMIVSHAARTLFAKSGDFTVTPGTSNISVNVIAGDFAAGTVLFLHLDRSDALAEDSEPLDLANPNSMGLMELVKINLGAPATASANAAVLSQAATALSGLATGINGALASGGVATFDVPRNVVAAWTGTAILTVTGTDEYGNVLVESSASGTSLTGNKAFKTITGISVSADVTGLTVGTGTKLGLPAFLADTVDVLREILDGAAATAGTIVAGVIATATATTGDVRGTYTPSSAPNGTRVYELIAALRNPAFKGAAQFAG